MTPWIVACQAPLSLGFSRQEYWSGLPCPPAGDLSGPEMELWYYALQADSLLYEPPGKISIVIFLNLKTKLKNQKKINPNNQKNLGPGNHHLLNTHTHTHTRPSSTREGVLDEPLAA